MDITSQAEKALQLVNRQRQELQDILQESMQSPDSQTPREKLKRWRDLTAQLLTQDVHPAEGEKLRRLGAGMLSVMSTIYSVVRSDVQKYDAFLVALIGAIREHPEITLRPVVGSPAPQNNSAATPPGRRLQDPRKVFVVYGRNEKARTAMFQFLRSLDLEPLEWLHAAALSPNPSPYVGEILEEAFKTAQAFVILFSGDDEARLRSPFQKVTDEPYEAELTPQPRPNVLFEAGLAFGTQPDRVVLVELGKVRPISDLTGRFLVRLTNAVASRQDLINRLRKAGCQLNADATDWHSAGDFESAINISDVTSAVSPAAPAQFHDWHYHFRVIELVTANGTRQQPKYVFNQSKAAFDNVASRLKSGKTFQLEGILVGAFQINNGFVGFSILRSRELADISELPQANPPQLEEFWIKLQYTPNVTNITSELEISDPHAK